MGIIKEYIGYHRYSDVYKSLSSYDSYYVKFLKKAEEYGINLRDIPKCQDGSHVMSDILDKYKVYLADKIASGDVETNCSNDKKLYIFCINLYFMLQDVSKIGIEYTFSEYYDLLCWSDERKRTLTEKGKVVFLCMYVCKKYMWNNVPDSFSEFIDEEMKSERAVTDAIISRAGK